MYEFMNSFDIQIRSYMAKDIEQLIDIQRECFPPPYPEEQLWSPEQLLSQIKIFPEGAICAETEGKLIGSATALITEWKPGDPPHSWAEVADNGFIRTHNPTGNSLYGIDIAVRPSWRRRGVARMLYEARLELMKKLKLRCLLVGGRMSGYHRYQQSLTPLAYLQKVISGEVADPTLTPQLRAGFKPVEIIENYIPDEESANYAVLLLLPNPEIGA